MNDQNQNHSSHPDELLPQLESAVWAVLSEPLPNDAIERVKSNAKGLESAPVSLNTPTCRPSFLRRQWPKLAALAACLLLLAGTMTFLPENDLMAQVVEQIKKVSTAKYVAEELGPQGIIAIARARSPHLLRLDFQDPSQAVSINNGSTGEFISYDNVSDEVKISAIPKASASFDILQLLTRPDAKAELSQEPNSIADTQLFEILDGKGRIWVSRQTKLPVRIELPSPTFDGTTKRVYRDFEWNIAIDDEWFEVPAGKRVVRSNLLATPTELELIAAFAIRQAFSSEPYESDFFEKSHQPGLKLGQLAYDLSQGPKENYARQSTKLRDHWNQIGISDSESGDPALVQKRIDYLCMKLDDWANTISRQGGWVGSGVRPGESKPLCWWRSGKKLRVLLGDLTIEDADQPPTAN